MSLSSHIKHFFHIISNIRPVVWIGLYVCLTPIFATIYWALPDEQFRIPDGAGTDWGSWLYYSIVTITTLGFGDYTPAHGWAQAVTAVEVMCGLVFLGFFLNAVGSLKSEIDIESEVEKQKRAHYAMEREKLLKSLPQVLASLDSFLSICSSITGAGHQSETDKKSESRRVLKSAAHSSLILDSLQSRIDLTLWPEILELCFSFVANYQLYTISGRTATSQAGPEENKRYADADLYDFIKENETVASSLLTALSHLSTDISQPLFHN